MNLKITKKIFINYATFIILLMAISGCAQVYNGNLLGSASLQSANFDYIKQNARGTSRAAYFLGIGGFNKSLIQKAKIDLLSNYPLESNQALVNQTINFNTRFVLGIIIIVECEVYSDIVEFQK
jgi:hypothetical protein